MQVRQPGVAVQLTNLPSKACDDSVSSPAVRAEADVLAERVRAACDGQSIVDVVANRKFRRCERVLCDVASSATGPRDTAQVSRGVLAGELSLVGREPERKCTWLRRHREACWLTGGRSA